MSFTTQENAPDSSRKTIAEKCGNDAAAIEAMRKRWSRYIGTAFDRNHVATDAEMSLLYPTGNARTKKPTKETKAETLDIPKAETKADVLPEIKAETDTTPQPDTDTETTKKAETDTDTTKRTNGQKAVLIACMAVPAIASLQNMWAVTSDISGHISMSVLLTLLFSAFPFALTLAGATTKAGRILVGFMIVYEGFCNFIRIYGGLTGFGKDGYPTRFLGIVTEVLNTGTYGTATVLAAIMALLCGAVFYISYNELLKK
jgi:hypothetical protein